MGKRKVKEEMMKRRKISMKKVRRMVMAEVMTRMKKMMMTTITLIWKTAKMIR